LDVTSESAIVRAGPSRSPDQTAGYVLFPPQGTRFVATGRRDFKYRVKLSSTKDGWISVKDVREMPEGTLPPEAVVGTVRVSLSGRHTVVRAALSSPVPFEIRSSDSGRFMDVSFYGAYSDTDWMNYSPSSGTVVRRLEWFQDDTDTYRLRLHLVPSRWWGYDARYQNGTFVLELKSPPARLKGASPLSGLTVAVDPGHSATTGAVGPTGLMEKDANLWIALALEKKLIKEGARVVMLRLENEDVPLLERPKRAVLAGADVFISVHNNSLPEGGNPLETNGYGVYYFTPAGFDLAEKIHRAYGEMFGSEKKKNSTVLRDDGLHYGNLAVIRLTQMPAVLTESAYIILPREEALLKTEMFADGCAEAMTRGLIRFVEEQQVKD